MSRGVVYIAFGEQYIEEAISSARSLTGYNIPCSLIVPEEAELRSADRDLFDNVIRRKDLKEYRDKVRLITESPYDRTLLLDTDTLIVGDISPIFDILDRVDVAMARSATNVIDFEGITGSFPEEFVDIPDSFPEFNGGVIVFSDTENVNIFLNKWWELYEKQLERASEGSKYVNSELNQPSLRNSLYQTDVSYSVLPREYNFRGPGASVFNEVKIIHQRDLINNKKFIKNINKEKTIRCVWRWKLYQWGEKDIVFGKEPTTVRFLYHLKQMLPLTEWLAAIGKLEKAKEYYSRYIR